MISGINVLSDLERRIDFKLTNAEVETAFDNFYEKHKGNFKLNGFRNGMAPKELVKKKYADVIKTEVSTQLVHSAVGNAVSSGELNIVGNPQLVEEFRSTNTKKHIGDFKLDGSFVFSIIAEAAPEVNIENYKGISVDVELPSSERWIASRITEHQKSFAEKTNVDREARTGDEIVVDYIASIKGEMLVDGSETVRTLVLGDKALLPEIEENFIGKRADEEFTFSITFNNDLGDKVFSGQTVDFKAKIHTIAEVVLPPVDDRLAQNALYENLEQMNSELKAQAEADFEIPRKAQIVEAIISKIIEANPFPVPNAWIDNEIKVIAHKLGLKSMAEEKYVEALKPTAIRSVQQAFILDQIYKKEKDIHMSAADVKEALSRDSVKIGKKPEEYLSMLKSSNSYEGFISFIEQQRAIDFLISSAIIKDKV